MFLLVGQWLHVNQKVTAHSSFSFFTNFVLRQSWNDWIILQNESWIIIWKREKIISCRNNLISWNQFYEKYLEINFILEVVFIKLISGKKFVKSIFHSILPDNATFPKWISDYVDQNVMAHSSLSFSQNFGLRHSWNDWIILQTESWIIIWKREKIISCRNNGTFIFVIFTKVLIF